MLHEEEELLPQFMAAEGVSPEYLMQLGRVFESAKLIAPSRCVCVCVSSPAGWHLLTGLTGCTCLVACKPGCVHRASMFVAPDTLLAAVLLLCGVCLNKQAVLRTHALVFALCSVVQAVPLGRQQAAPQPGVQGCHHTCGLCAGHGSI